MKIIKNNRMNNAFLGPETSINGTLEFDGTVRLDGRITGNIVSPTGTVVIGKHALIKADISVGVALISGEVIGSIKAADKIELYPSAKITGDLIAKIIRIETGARFIGNCSTSQKNNLAINSDKYENSNRPGTSASK